ncbi:MAG TPA: hypothetical protein VKT30_10235 [Caulobacteraceae bacterium]|nr:hypothetical protein [Caulobacteraceae bacterium]
MASPSTQTVLSVLAMIALGALGGLLTFQAVPPANVQLLTFILGAIAGAVTGGAAVKAADARPAQASDAA